MERFSQSKTFLICPFARSLMGVLNGAKPPEHPTMVPSFPTLHPNRETIWPKKGLQMNYRYKLADSQPKIMAWKEICPHFGTGLFMQRNLHISTSLLLAKLGWKKRPSRIYYIGEEEKENSFIIHASSYWRVMNEEWMALW